MAERCITFDCEGDTLLGILHEPEGPIRHVGILVIVGGPQYRVGSHRQFVLMARQLAAVGYPVVRFDYRGMGDSDGAPRTFEAVEADVGAAIHAMLGECPGLRGLVVLGLCDAASAAVMFCSGDPRVVGMILANPWARTEAGHARAIVRHYYLGRVLQRGFWTKLLAGHVHPLRAFREFVASWSTARASRQKMGQAHFLDRMASALGAMRKPTFLLMSGRDLTAREFDQWWRANLDRAGSGVSNMLERLDLPQADHTLSSKDDLKVAIDAILRWLESRQFRAGYAGVAG